jgi:predicted Zn-dependent protease
MTTATYRAFIAAPGRAATIASIAAIALMCAWTIWQPLRSANADAAALVALSADHTGAALADVRSAAVIDPFSTQPLLYEWQIYSFEGDTASARAALEADVALQPANPDTWLGLGEYDADIGKPREAIAALEAELYLFPTDPNTASVLAQARAEL